MLLKITIASAIFCAVGVDAFWRMECPHRVGLGRIDPLTNPGTISQHAHAIYGSNGFGMSSLFDDLAAGNCTSCRVTQDKSAYWHPQLYFKDDATGQYEEVDPLGGMLAYYFLNGDDIKPFKPGFRMIAGDNKRRNFTAPWDSHEPDPEKSVWRAKGYVEQDILKQLAIGVNCLNYAKPGEPTLMRHYLPDKAYIDANCPDGIRFELMFPSCWVGGDTVDSPNHMDHVAYPDTVMDGNCPEEFPVRLPGLMFESFYNTGEFKDRSGTFVLSNGDVDGYGYHGDFISGWDEQILGQAVKTCTNPSGRIEDCPVFNLQSESEASQCNMDIPDILAHEDVIGPMSTLPGGIQIGGSIGDIVDGITDIIGGGKDPAPDDATSNSTPLGIAPGIGVAEQQPTAEPPVDPESTPVEPPAEQPISAAPGPEALVQDGSTPEQAGPERPASAPEEPGSKESALGESTPQEPAITDAAEPTAPEEGLDIISTEYIRDGNMVSKIVWVEDIVYVTETAYEICTPAAAPAKAKRTHARMRRHSHHYH